MRARKIAIIFTVIYFIALPFLHGQNLIKQWDKRFGGYDEDMLNDIILTNDEGFLLAGWTSSLAQGDVTEPSRDSTFDPSGDYWIVKLDIAGNKQWDKRLGGDAEDLLNCVMQTSDGGYLLGGSSTSYANGDKSQNSSGENFWVVKTDSTGNKQWDKTYGTTNGREELFSIIETGHRQYILAGISYAGISGDKTDTSRGGMDFWVIKIDSSGNKLWDKTYGGSKDDYLKTVINTNDNSYILAGGSMSGISGDKTQPNWDSTNTTFDFWIIKIDTLGNKLWDKRYGGTKGEYAKDIKQTNDGGCIIGGTSGSPISGDKTQNYWGNSTTADYWILKTDGDGNKQWDKRYGGDNHELLLSVSITADDGYLFYGLSWSNTSADKSENNFGTWQSWVVKTNSTGSKQWDKTMFTAQPSFGGPYPNKGAIQTKDGCYVAANRNLSDTGGYKSQPSWGDGDWWVIKFCIDTLTSSIETEKENSFTLSPNPTTNTLTIQTNATGNLTYQVLATDGRTLIQNKTTNQPNIEIDVSTLPAGLYFLQLQDNRNRWVKKFIKQ